MDNSGQLSADFLFATLILIIIIGALTNIASSGMDAANNAEFSKAKVLADSVSRTIDSVYSNGYGQYAVFSFPTDFNYTVAVDNEKVSVTYKNKTSISNIIPKNHIDSKTINPGEKYNITNTKGQIKLQKIT
ncbi:hypothetical protein [Methanobacterium sp. ACI-7]|uniref:hypothetical protein n=1 Tax=unclassified Methanobacterium TaxID=2627676 RepID=UPI0039C3790B